MLQPGPPDEELDDEADDELEPPEEDPEVPDDDPELLDVEEEEPFDPPELIDEPPSAPASSAAGVVDSVVLLAPVPAAQPNAAESAANALIDTTKRSDRMAGLLERNRARKRAVTAS